jgi:flagellar protein FlaF
MAYDPVAKYQRASEASAPPRDTEIMAFGFVNRLLGDDQDARKRMKALGKNHELWSLLLKDLSRSGNAVPEGLKQQLVSLGAWSMHYSVKAMCTGLPVGPLIEVNRNIVDGLRAQAPNHVPAPACPAAAPFSASIAV